MNNPTPPLPIARLLIVAALTVPWLLFLGFDFAALAGSGATIPSGSDWLMGFLAMALLCSLPFALLFAWLAPVFVVKSYREKFRLVSPTKAMLGIHLLVQGVLFGMSSVAASILPSLFPFCAALPCILLHLAAPIFSARVSLQVTDAKEAPIP